MNFNYNIEDEVKAIEKQMKRMLKIWKLPLFLELRVVNKDKFKPRSLAQAFSVPREGVMKKLITTAQTLPRSFVIARLGLLLLYQ